MKTHKSLLITFFSFSLLLFLGNGFAQGSEKKGEGYLGVIIANLNKAEICISGITYGVKITRILDDSPAEKSGLKEYDIIQEFNHQKIEDTEDLYDRVRETEPETKVTISFLREGKPESTEVTLEKRKSYKNFSFSSHPFHKFYTMQMGPYLGIQLQDLNAELGKYFGVKKGDGVLVLSVMDDSPADKADFKAGDIIIQIEEEKIEDAKDVLDIVSDYQEGDTLHISLIRHQKEMTLQVQLEKDHDHNIDIFKWHGQVPEKHLRVFEYENKPHSLEFDIEKDFIPEIKEHLKKNIYKHQDNDILLHNRLKDNRKKYKNKIIVI